MTLPIPYWHVDAFATQPFTGNQAAVMLLDAWPDDAVLQAIGAENMFAETAFILPDASGEADWELRWFTPEIEIGLCGHATLASGHVLLARDPALERVTFRTRSSGLLEVRRLGAGYEVALPALATAPADWPEGAALLGGAPQEIWRSANGYYNIFRYGSEADLRGLSPDFRALAALGEHDFIATAPGTDSDVVSRVFVPCAGVDEDAVTGSAHAALTPYWTAQLGRDHFSAFQASQRGGRLACRLADGMAWLGGHCVTVVEGTFRL